MMARKRSILYLTNKGLQLDLSAHALSKLFARYEIFKMGLNLPGDIVDCGVYRGASLFSCGNLIKIFAPHSQKVVIGFDTFSGFSSNLHIMEVRDHSVKLMEDRTDFFLEAVSMTSLGPRRSVSQPTQGVTTAETRNPNEKAPAVTPRSHPNSSRICGNSRE